MGQASPQRCSTEISFAALAVLISSWLPWGVLSGPAPPVLLIGKELSVILDAWNSHIRLFGIQFPNSFPLLEAALLVVLAWCRTSGAWSAPRKLLLSVTFLGLYQVLRFLWAVGASGGVAGIGAILTTASFVWMLVAIVRLPPLPLPRPARSSSQTVEAG